MLTYGEWLRQRGLGLKGAPDGSNSSRPVTSRDMEIYGEYHQYVERQRQAEEAEAAEAARQRAAAEASLKESQERLRLENEQAAQDENKRNANDPNIAELRGLGFKANQGGEGDGGGSAMTELAGLGGVGPDNMRLSRRKLLGGR